MKKRLIFRIVSIFILIIILFISFYFIKDIKTYILNLPNSDTLESIDIENVNKNRKYSLKSDIEKILNNLNGVKRVTNKKSIQDYPIDVVDEIEIDFIHKEGVISTIYVYKKNNKYFIEQPYNGIYAISKYEYELIEKLL